MDWAAFSGAASTSLPSTTSHRLPVGDVSQFGSQVKACKLRGEIYTCGRKDKESSPKITAK
jgi:hypothetical protein